MELLARREKLIANNLVRYGREFKREFSISLYEIKISFVVPLQILKAIDFFTIKYKDVEDKGITNDVVVMKSDNMELYNMQTFEIKDDTTYAKLIYKGIASKIDKSCITEHKSCITEHSSLIDTLNLNQTPLVYTGNRDMIYLH